MAQFTSLSTNSEMNETLKQIASKLDALGAAQTAFLESANTSQE
jgi:flagellar hook assembly protein FlgD